MPIFDENGKIVSPNRTPLDTGFPNLKGSDETSGGGRRTSLSLPDNMSVTTIGLAAAVLVLLVGIVILVLKTSSLSGEVNALSKENRQLKAAKSPYDELEARVRKLEEATKRKPQSVSG